MGLIAEAKSNRELIRNLTLREIRGKYKRTLLGQGWSLLNPIAQMAIYTLVFGFVLRAQPEPGDPSGLDIFALWVTCALLPWGMFANAVSTGMGSLVGNAGLVQKVYFPRWILVLANVAAAVATFLFELVVLTIAIMLFGGNPLLQLPLALIVILLLAMFSFGIALALSVITVYFRDTSHLMAIVMQIWFYATPIVYPIQLVQTNLADHPLILLIYRFNPMEQFVAAFRAIFYDNTWPSANNLLACLISAVVSLAIGAWIFRKLEGRVSEEL
ncbi:ABC transporter permease [Epidermidibacterium keratini]|uniref:Transport permease protein n=1 Tax=Epidermidibacterium keratini TaxID=1891644 RepID=A0A7L4YNK1_9ACTN|nr:ABC transporter permease [Epidermidibacterium keratini]QHC00716.1 ABC transporter permease [Epidermidibacterium keratini]